MSFGWRHFFDNRLVAWKRTLRTADNKSERSIDIHTDHRLLVTRENSQWRGVVACGEITNMWFTELNREKAPESSLNSCHENLQHLLKEPSNNDSTQSLFSFAKRFITEKYYIRRKKVDEEGNLRIDCDISSHLEVFFFSLRQKRESVSSFFWFSLAFIYFV